MTPAVFTPMRSSRRHRQRGVALVLVLTALTILAVMLTEFQDEGSTELSGALAGPETTRL